MKYLQNLTTISIAVAFFSSSYGQTIDGGWKGIQPLVSSKTTVEKVVGARKISDRRWYYVDYETDETYVEVNYSTEPCKPDRYSRGDYSVPEGTVLDYLVRFKKPPRFVDLDIEHSAYLKDTSGDARHYVTYRNNKAGVTISVRYEGDEKLVERMEFRPSYVNLERFKC